MADETSISEVSRVKRSSPLKSGQKTPPAAVSAKKSDITSGSCTTSSPPKQQASVNPNPKPMSPTRTTATSSFGVVVTPHPDDGAGVVLL